MRLIDWVCFYNRSGYAQAAQDYIYALRASGQYEVHISLLHAAPDQMSITKERLLETQAMMKTSVPQDTIQIFHCIPEMQRRANRHRKGIGFATFETYEPPKPWIDILNTNTAVICQSMFNKDVFVRAGVKVPIFHVPHVLDTKLFNPDVQPQNKDDLFTFLFFGAWKQRKGWKELLEAWFREFTPQDKVRLLIKTDRLALANRDILETRKNIGLAEKDTAPISFETRILNEVDLPHFVKSADCLISPTYGEGFGLPGLQCMAMGVPVVITDFSGCKDYATDETATLLKPSGFILYNEMDGIPQFRQKRWSMISVEEIRNKMRYVINNKEEVNNKAKKAVQFVHANFNYQVAAARFSEMMATM